MTSDEIIKLAREAAAQHGHTIKPTDEIVETLTSFAYLVAAAEREACAKEGWLAASSDCEDRVAAAIRARNK